MNKNLFAVMLTLSAIAPTCIFATDTTGISGDHFSLEGALDMFRKAIDLEAFEKALNEEANAINNLDLNVDGETDYIRTEALSQGDLRVIVLQAVLSETEVQDVAVIEIEKSEGEHAMLQMVGDETLYGTGHYLEPFDEKSMKSQRGPSEEFELQYISVNVWVWPSVRYLYAPSFGSWVSPWRWGVYPRWWKPWRPFARHLHHSRCSIYTGHFHVVHTHRVSRAHSIYTPHRKASALTAGHQKNNTLSRGNSAKSTVGKRAVGKAKGGSAKSKSKTGKARSGR